MAKTKLQEKRLEANLSQSQLAEKSGVNIRTIQHYEFGDKNIKKAAVETVLALSEALGCDIKEII